jgi:ArsR family transcriptional regulator, lead/cadmium/zinc/bismuth-responsive transcriptional repressor
MLARNMTEDGCGELHLAEEQVQEAMSYLVDDGSVAALADMFKALSDPTRLRIVSLLAETELCVCDLAAVLDMEQSAVSHQLRTLRDMHLVRRRREGRRIFYALDDDHVVDLFRRGLEHVTHA